MAGREQDPPPVEGEFLPIEKDTSTIGKGANFKDRAVTLKTDASTVDWTRSFTSLD